MIQTRARAGFEQARGDTDQRERGGAASPAVAPCMSPWLLDKPLKVEVRQLVVGHHHPNGAQGLRLMGQQPHLRPFFADFSHHSSRERLSGVYPTATATSESRGSRARPAQASAASRASRSSVHREFGSAGTAPNKARIQMDETP
jgi:hypothetical protein